MANQETHPNIENIKNTILEGKPVVRWFGEKRFEYGFSDVLAEIDFAKQEEVLFKLLTAKGLERNKLVDELNNLHTQAALILAEEIHINFDKGFSESA